MFWHSFAGLTWGFPNKIASVAFWLLGWVRQHWLDKKFGRAQCFLNAQQNANHTIVYSVAMSQ